MSALEEYKRERVRNAVDRAIAGEWIDSGDRLLVAEYTNFRIGVHDFTLGLFFDWRLDPAARKALSEFVARGRS